MILPGVVGHPGGLAGGGCDHGGEVDVARIPEARVQAVAVQVVVGHGGLGGAAPRPRHRLGVCPRHARIFSEIFCMKSR